MTLIMIPTIMVPMALTLSFPGKFIYLASAGTKSATIPRSITRIPAPIMNVIIVSLVHPFLCT